MKILNLSFAAGLLIALAGCTTTGDIESAPPVEDRAVGAEGTGASSTGEAGAGAQTSGAAGTAAFQGDVLDDPASPLSERIIYFEFDSSELKPEYQELLRAHAGYLAAHPEKRLAVEGHTDERGTREYNLALGERRADAVKRVLVLNGALAEQVEAISFGEEKPVYTGSDDAGMIENRRAELNYTQR